MEIIQLPAMYFFGRSFTCDFEGMLQHVRVLPRELFAQSQQLGLEIAGVMQWHYVDFNPQPGALFQLRIGFPVVAKKEVPSPYEIIELPSFKCAAALHLGAWDKFSNTYSQLVDFVQENNLHFTGHNRECYMLCNFEQADNNITYIQIGVQ
ncbi:GyrI-like small molecule binding protein [Chitinophaga skermanii]|uniref:GyrI-like small molecule binding protein n=1 Tax=Chitinophaga skermanii TaxID=331697 RepID=A0A327QJ70_9BACT|nr:GyrI-like domain-containing protein [Chitinophaga skermanii]RAJ04028.1 GyrI-like small molecule binding protein [Chitinophaga skermanii]